MRRCVLTLASGLFAAGVVGSAIAAVPDPSPFTWSSPLSVSGEVQLPDVPPPPRQTTPVLVGGDVVLANQPRVSAVPCPDRTKRLSVSDAVTSRATAEPHDRRVVHPAG